MVTCAEMPELDDDWPLLRAALEAAGWETSVVEWNDPLVEWGRFDVVVVRVAAWAYIHHPAAFRTWAASVQEHSVLVNPAPVLSWNLDKRYLAELAADGVPVVATQWVTPSEACQPPPGQFVIKPTRAAGCFETARYGPEHILAAVDHVKRLHHAGFTVMVQPYLAGVDNHGETALVYIAGRFSHAVCKQPLLRLGVGVIDRLWEHERLTSKQATPLELQVGASAMASVENRVGPCLYARVDLLPAETTTPLVSEVELIDPSLHFSFDPAAADRLAEALTSRIGA